VELIAKDNSKIVVGLGITGLSCARYLKRKKQPFIVVDSRSNPPGLELFKQEFPEIELILGKLTEKDLVGANELIVSPGVSLEEPVIANAIANGVSVCGDIDLFCREASAPIIAITGSNGKSTVTTLVGEMAKRAGINVAVGGNIGIPALDLLTQENIDLYVLELSSFQLERAGDLSVEVATVLNVSPDHMDRYPNLLAYHAAKHRIFRGCKQIVINRSDSLSKPLLTENVKVWTFALTKPDFNGFGLIKSDDAKTEYIAYQFDRLMPVAELKMAGRHNVENALSALALGQAMNFDMQAMLAVLREFKGLDHRCQFVAEYQDVKFYNDSKGTNVGAAIASIMGLADSAGRIILIAGGESKDADFTPLINIIAVHVRAVVLIGSAANAIETMIKASAPDVVVVTALTMDGAVASASSCAQQGDVVLLSPACASFDMFDDYQHRGNVFRDSVLQLASSDQSNRGCQ
jgi:UDP-N-acetylmuramoylalanine--D-glutamate ligase